MAKKAKTTDMTTPMADQEWRAEDDLRAMKTVAECKADPKRMKAVADLIEKQEKALACVKPMAGKGRMSAFYRSRAKKG